MSDTSTDGTERPRGRDSEVLDYVDRRGPISANRIVEECGSWSPDEVYTSLKSLESDGFVGSKKGDLERFGTTRRIWYVAPGTDRSEEDGAS